MTHFLAEPIGTSLKEVREAQGVPDVLEDDAEHLCIALVHALHRHGLPGHRLETASQNLSMALGLTTQLLALPTSLVFAFGEGLHQRTVLLRVKPSGLDLGRLADLDDLFRAVVDGSLDVRAARAELDRVLHAPRRWSALTDVVCGAIAAATAAALFPGASTHDMLVAGVAGTVVAVLLLLSTRSRALEESWMALASFVAASAASWASTVLPDIHSGIVTVAGIIVLVPGLSFTISMMELATRNLSSAVARFADVGLTLIQLGFGVVLARALWSAPADPLPSDLPAWALPTALLLLPGTIAVMFGARGRDLPVITAASVGGWLAFRASDQLVDWPVSAMIGTFVLGATSTVWARWARRPAIIPIVTGLFLLVPGSLGFQGVVALLTGHTLSGIETLFRMAMGAFGLAAGLVLSSSMLRKRGT